MSTFLCSAVETGAETISRFFFFIYSNELTQSKHKKLVWLIFQECIESSLEKEMQQGRQILRCLTRKTLNLKFKRIAVTHITITPPLTRRIWNLSRDVCRLASALWDALTLAEVTGVLYFLINQSLEAAHIRFFFFKALFSQQEWLEIYRKEHNSTRKQWESLTTTLYCQNTPTHNHTHTEWGGGCDDLQLQDSQVGLQVIEILFGLSLHVALQRWKVFWVVPAKRDKTHQSCVEIWVFGCPEFTYSTLRLTVSAPSNSAYLVQCFFARQWL